MNLGYKLIADLNSEEWQIVDVDSLKVTVHKELTKPSLVNNEGCPIILGEFESNVDNNYITLSKVVISIRHLQFYKGLLFGEVITENNTIKTLVEHNIPLTFVPILQGVEQNGKFMATRIMAVDVGSEMVGEGSYDICKLIFGDGRFIKIRKNSGKI